MKKLYVLFSFLFLFAFSILFAYVPQSFNYQAVVRDASGIVLENQNVGVQILILKGTIDGSSVYSETHSVSTNQFGLINLKVGMGTTTDNFSEIDWASDSYFIKVEVDPTGGTDYQEMGTSQLLSVPYALYAKTAEIFNEVDGDVTNEIQDISLNGNKLSISKGSTVTLPAGGGISVPIYNTDEIVALTPTEGDAVFNSTEKLFQIYQGGAWQSFNSNCWPQPTVAHAGSNQTFTDGTTTTSLSANTPASKHGTGAWTIISGTGGSFADDTIPTTIFTGIECTAYTLQWTISTSCNSSSDNVTVEFNQTPTVTDAGSDQTLTDGTTTAILSANTPDAEHGTGKWTIVSGTGGSFIDDTNPTTTFTGTLHEVYTLRWTITTFCNSSIDEVIIAFQQNGAGSTVADIDGNTYNTVWIGNQLWMAENLKVTKKSDGTAIPNITVNNDWGNLGDNDTDKAYCYYDNSTDSLAIYGALYTYAAAKDACPIGWHLPTDTEWTELETYISNDGLSGVEGSALKSITGWNNSGNGTDDYGFAALPGGYREFINGTFNYVGDNGNWWSATEDGSSTALCRNLDNAHTIVYRIKHYKSNGFSIRCVRD